MKKTKVEPLQESSYEISESSLTRLTKGTESDHNGCIHVMGNGQTVLGSKMASKVFKNMHDVELGKPNMLQKLVGTP